MRLKKLKLVGFKSFVDPTLIPLPSQLVAVIGPNGCGKSNVVDAIRWVMGSSAKHVRGEEMTDVIFKGTTARKPVGQASVELIFDNQEGKVGGQYASYSEIAIKRIINREAISSYHLNGTRCRRKDIADLFFGTGLGPKNYAIIEQGMISRFLEAKPDEIRTFIEEPAGIAKYKSRRRDTELRMEHTQENLQRLNDILQEKNQHLAKLQRQAKTAEKYQSYKQEQRLQQAQWNAMQWNQLHEQTLLEKKAIQEDQLTYEENRANLRHLESKVTTHWEQHVCATDDLQTHQQHYQRLSSEIARLEEAKKQQQAQRKQLEEDIFYHKTECDQHTQQTLARTATINNLKKTLQELIPEFDSLKQQKKEINTQREICEEQWSSWQKKWDTFSEEQSKSQKTAEIAKTRLVHLEAQISKEQIRIHTLTEEKKRLDISDYQSQRALALQQTHESEQKKQTAEQALTSLVETLTSQQTKIANTQKEYDALKNSHQLNQAKLLSLQTLQKEVLHKPNESLKPWLDELGLYADRVLGTQLSVATGWEKAVETVLHAHLKAIATETLNIEKFMAKLPSQSIQLLVEQPEKLVTLKEPNRLLIGKIQTNCYAVYNLLSTVYIAEDELKANALLSELPAEASVVTPSGVWIGQGWIVYHREHHSEGGILQREQAIHTLEIETEKQAVEIGTLENALQTQKLVLSEQQEKRENLQTDVSEATRHFIEVGAKNEYLQKKITDIQEREKQLSQEINELTENIRQWKDELNTEKHTWSQAVRAMETLQCERSVLLESKARFSQELRQLRADDQSIQSAYHTHELSIQAKRTQLDNEQQLIEQLDKQITFHQKRRAELDIKWHASEPSGEMTQQLSEKLLLLKQADERLKTARDTLQTITDHLHELDDDRKTIETTLQEIQQTMNEKNVAAENTKVRAATLAEIIQSSGFDKEDVLSNLPEDASIELLEDSLQKLEQKIQRLGSINLIAVEEYETELKQKEYLDSQYNDLTEALETLRSAIDKIDRETKDRFKKTFDDVNSNFQTLFPKLFNGGHASLELTESDLLTAGIQIQASPPGKRNTSIHLLSGGEKALTTIALIFAIFQLNPAPFCVLDEVDAPLDDANVLRFCELVKIMSEKVQFIIITHNKNTMELAHHLTGVTMQEPGVSKIVAVDVEEAIQLAEVS